MEMFFRLIEKKISGDHGKNGRSNFKREINETGIQALLCDKDVCEPVIDKYKVYDQKPDLINVQ